MTTDGTGISTDNQDENTINKLDAIILNNGWNDKNEVLIVSIGENSASFKWMHDKCSHQYSLYNKILSITVILFNSVLSAESLIPSENTNYTIILIQKVLIYIVTLLSVVSNFLKFEELSTKHSNSSSGFSELYHDIQQQMCMYRKDRSNAVKYISNILKKYDSLIAASPNITNAILKQFKKQFQNSNISMPEIADKIQKIDIIVQPSDMNSHISNVTNINQLSQETYNIPGDILDNEVENLSEMLRERAIKAQTAYEYERYRSI